MSKICKECNRMMTYDPYFEKYVCRQCGRTEKIVCIVPIKRNSQIKKSNSSNAFGVLVK